jgi:hypothetical protein
MHSGKTFASSNIAFGMQGGLLTPLRSEVEAGGLYASQLYVAHEGRIP